MKNSKKRSASSGNNNNWLWRNMYSVAEEDEEHEDLADFGLSSGLLNDALLEDHMNHADVDELINNPMAASIKQSPQRRCNNNNSTYQQKQRHDDDFEEHGAFVLLRRLKLLPKNEGYAYVSDLDAFFTSLYTYYYHRGLGSIIGKGIVEIVSLFFTLWLSLVLFAYIDWKGLSTCNDEHTCSESFIDSYIIQNPFSTSGFLANTWIVIYCLLFSTYGFFCLVQFGNGIIASIESKLFLEEVLGVSDRDLDTGRIGWGDIVERMSEAQRMGKCRVAILPGRIGADMIDQAQSRSFAESASMNHQHQLPHNQQQQIEDGQTGHLVVAQRIMRRENYMIAFFNKGLLDLTLPPLPPIKYRGYTIRLWPLTALTNKPKGEKVSFYSKSIEWSIYFCVLNYMFNHSRKIRPAFYGDPSSLRRRFFLCGIFHAIFMPFLLFFVTLHFFMSNIYDWQSTKEYLGPREWSSIAQWTFREFNELPHSFEKRMEPSYKSAARYLDMFGKPSPVKVAIGRLLVFVSGSLGTLLLAFAAMNDAILLHVKIGNWNLLWYAGILGASFSIGKSLLPKADSPYFGHARGNLINNMNLELEKLAMYTHYLPDSWRERGYDDKTKSEFAPMFQYKASLFAMEVLSIIAAPLILCVSLPRCADKLCRFVRDSKVEVPTVGDVVGYSTFDFESFEDENWRNGGDFEQSSRTSTTVNDRPKSQHGKMEKSFFNFKSVYPNWTMPQSGKNLVDKIESYRHHQDLALARERRLHINAAAAQLETLRRIELDRQRQASAGLVGLVNHQYHNPPPGPDSGGGGDRGIELSQQQSTEMSGNFGSLSQDELHQPQVHFEESIHSFAPPSHAFAHTDDNGGGDSYSLEPLSSSQHMMMNNNQGASIEAGGLSIELRGLLNQSTLVDPLASSQQSFTGSLIALDELSTSILERRPDQQFAYLDNYHRATSRYQADNRQRREG